MDSVLSHIAKYLRKEPKRRLSHFRYTYWHINVSITFTYNIVIMHDNTMLDVQLCWNPLPFAHIDGHFNTLIQLIKSHETVIKLLRVILVQETGSYTFIWS